MEKLISSASDNSTISSSTQHNRPTNRKRKAENKTSSLAQRSAKRIKPDDYNLYKRIYSHSRKYVSPPKQVQPQDNHLLVKLNDNVYPVMNPKVVLRRLNIDIPYKYIQEQEDKVSKISMKDTSAIVVENHFKIDGTTQTDEESLIPSTEMLKVLSSIANPKVATTIGTQTDNTGDEVERKQFLKFFQETQNIKIETIDKADFNQQTECTPCSDFTCQVMFSDSPSNNVAEETIKNLRRNVDVSEEIIKDLRQAIGVSHLTIEEHKKTISFLESRLLKANLKLMERCGISIVEKDKHNKIPVEQVLASPEDVTFILPASITPPLILTNSSMGTTEVSIPQNDEPIIPQLSPIVVPAVKGLSTKEHTSSSIHTVIPQNVLNQPMSAQTASTPAEITTSNSPTSESPINLQKIVTLPASSFISNSQSSSKTVNPHQQLPRQPRRKTTLTLGSKPSAFVNLYPSQTNNENTTNSDPIREATSLSNSAYQQQAHYFQQNLSSRQSPIHTANPMNLVWQQQPPPLQSQLQQKQMQSSHWHLLQSQQPQMQPFPIQQVQSSHMTQVQSSHMSLSQVQHSQILQSIMQRAPTGQPPHLRSPRMHSPQIQSPQTQSPQIQSPQIQSPQIQSPQIQSPQMQSPQMQLSMIKPPQTQTSVIQSSQIQQSQMQASPAQSFAMQPWQQMRGQNQINGTSSNVRQTNNFSSQFQPHFYSNQPINLSPTKRPTYQAQVPTDPRLSYQHNVNYRNQLRQNMSSTNSMYPQYQLHKQQHFQQSQCPPQQNQQYTNQQYASANQQYMPQQYTAHQSSSQQQSSQIFSNRLQQRSKTTYLPNIAQGQSSLHLNYLQSKDALQKQDAQKKQHALQQQQKDYEKQQALQKQQNEALQKNLALHMQRTIQNQGTLHTQITQPIQQQASQSHPSRLQQRAKTQHIAHKLYAGQNQSKHQDSEANTQVQHSKKQALQQQPVLEREEEQKRQQVLQKQYYRQDQEMQQNQQQVSQSHPSRLLVRAKTSLILKEQLAQNPHVLQKQQLQQQEAFKKYKEMNREEALLHQSIQQSLLMQQAVPNLEALSKHHAHEKHQAHHKRSTPQEEQRNQQQVPPNYSSHPSRLHQRAKTIFVEGTFAHDLSHKNMQSNAPTQAAVEKQKAQKKEETQKQDASKNRKYAKLQGVTQERVTPPLSCFYCLICHKEATIICETCHNVSSCSDHCYQQSKFKHENSCRAPNMIQVANIQLNNC